MIDELSIGTAQIPESAPGDPVVVVVPIEPDQLVTTYDVSLLLPTELPDTDVVVTAQDYDNVTLTVTRPDGYAGNPLTVFVLCINPITLDSGFVDASAGLYPGWTGSAFLRKLSNIVYFQFELTATASIDGTPKTDPVGVLDVEAALGGEWKSGTNQPLGGCYTDVNDPVRGFAEYDPVPNHGGCVFVEGAAGATGDWVDGVSTLYGQLSWFAGV